MPEKITIDKSGANKAAMNEINARGETPINVRQVKYLNNIVEQNHRAVKRVTKPMLNFKSFRSVKCVLTGIELMHMIRKGQLLLRGCIKLSFAEQFYALAGQIRLVLGTGTRPRQNHVHQWLTRQNRPRSIQRPASWRTYPLTNEQPPWSQVLACSNMSMT